MEPLAVTVRIETAIAGEETVSARYDGLLRARGEALLLSYTEEAEGVRTSTLLTIEEDKVSLVRRGGVEFSTVYRVGVPHASRYSLGGLSFDALTETVSLTVTRGVCLPRVLCVYDLTLGGERRRFSLSLITEKRRAEA